MKKFATKTFEFQKSAQCWGGPGRLAHPGGSDVESRGQSAETVVMRAKSERQIQSRLCVAAAVPTSSALPLLLSLLLLGSNSRGKGDQCRNPSERILQALEHARCMCVGAVTAMRMLEPRATM